MYFPPTANYSDSSTPDSACDTSNEPRFFPPLWQQRRNVARRILEENNATSVVDFGCGEAALLSLLIWETTGDYPITRLAGVELREERLQLAAEACQPQDFELGSNLRVNPLTIDLFQGSIDRPDARLIGFDALVCLEVVEHLDPPVLEKFWSVILGTLKPKLVIVSTPNAEFNVYFPQLNYGTPESIFRNDDHRFEWTRQEFQDWCNAAAGQYGYDVSYTGTGALPGYDPAVGLCTQFAVLHAQNPSQQHVPATPSTDNIDQPYHLFSRIEYPTYNEKHSDDDILVFLHEKIACIRPRLPQPDKDIYDSDGYHYGASYGQTSSNNGDTSPSNPSDPSDNVASDNTPHKQLETSDPEIELGVLPLEDLWQTLEVRQRCKSRSGMICILGQSPLVRVDQEAGLIRFDEDNSYWKEADALRDAPLSPQDEHSPRGFEIDDWSDSSFYNNDEADAEHQAYGQDYQGYTGENVQSDAPEDVGWPDWGGPAATHHQEEWNSP
ncbi:Small RNA 2'-O-methyltransferase [Mortierella sp. NVP41]|nr:Small RNA 2'-O-methyltransferase [Mortierella sp. NVP41]